MTFSLRRHGCRPLVALFLLLAVVLFGADLAAHPFDQVIPKMYVRVDPRTRTIDVEYQFLYSTIDTSLFEQRNWLDLNRDGMISESERRSRVREYLADTARMANLSVDDQACELQAIEAESEAYNLDSTTRAIEGVGDFKLGYVFVLRSLPLAALTPGLHRVRFYNAETRIQRQRSCADGMHAEIAVFKAYSGRWEFETPVDVRYDTVDGRFDLMSFDVDVPIEGGIQATTPTPPVAAGDRLEASLRGLTPSDNARAEHHLRALIRDIHGGGWPALLAIGAVFLLGCWHALQPGHGKTLVAGYLIGSQGRPADALLLGVTVTLAHTSGVFLVLAGWWLVIEHGSSFGIQIRDSKEVQDWLVIAIGATIFIMGAGLLLKRARGGGHYHDAFGRHTTENHAHDHDHAHDHHHHHDHGPHHHHDHKPAPDTSRRLSSWEVIRLGIVGGILPCPTAFVIALLTIGAGEVALGFVLLLVFSAGLALVLATIGLGMVLSKSYLAHRERSMGRLGRWFRAYVPTLGALVICLIGFTLVLAALYRIGVIDFATLMV